MQTEDSGRTHGHIYSHVFWSGTVIASRKTEYDRFKHASKSEIEKLMRASHRQMCIALRDGQYDEQIASLTARQPARRRRHQTSSNLAAIPTKAPQPHRAPAHPGSSTSTNELLNSASQEAAAKCLASLEVNITGFLGAALVSRGNDTTMRASKNALDMTQAASGTAELLQAKMSLLEKLDLGGTLQDIVVTLDHWFCIIRPLDEDRFLYMIVDRSQGNLSLARRAVLSAKV
ncbi:MAG: hypothetical protein KUG77_28640 [Nannocystaceae bacterium]|nr:hypothetical protein [Nannocystaceae bacterium]